MAKYRKKPVVVEAAQYRRGQPFPPGVSLDEQGSTHVVTIHKQKAFLDDGDWVIREPNGENYYPCKPDIFAATYEPVTT